MKVQIILPITEFLPTIHSSLSNKNNLVLQAEPGAGKSTELPLSLLDAPWLNGKKILMLEPRRVAAKSIAHYLAKKLDEKVGQKIGYQIKNERKISKETILEVVTEGVLTRRLQSDPEISNIGLIIFDEFHERSIHADLSLLLSLEVQQTIREDLKLLVMSATIDTKMISKYMGGATVIECPGRAFPVSVQYNLYNASTKFSTTSNRNVHKQNLVGQIVSALRDVLQQSSDGDVLVFLPGQADIRKCVSECHASFNSSSKIDFLPLYGGLSLSEQEKVLTLSHSGRKRVIFSTNIAETSLTIEGVTCVIDSGLEKNIIYDASSDMTRLETSYISKASAEQRKGRAGRTQAGQCIRLWNEQKQNSLKDYQGEEILSADLTGAVLDLCLWGAGEYHEINWLTAPPKPHYESAQTTLVSLGLIDSDNNVTTLGTKAAGIGVHPRLAAMLLKAGGHISYDKIKKNKIKKIKTEQINTEQGIASELAALQSDRDIFTNNNGVDIVERLLALQDYKVNKNSALKTFPIKRAVVEKLLATSISLRKIIKADKSTTIFSLTQLQNTIGKLLLFAYPERLAKMRSSTCGRYKLANGKGVFLYSDDSLFGYEWLVVADCDAQKKEGRIYNAAPITYETAIDCLSDKLIKKEYYKFDESKQKIIGRHSVNFKAIELKSTAISDIPPDAFQKCLAEIFKVQGIEILNWSSRCEALLLRAQWLGEHVGSFPNISRGMLIETIEQWLIPYLSKINSIAALKKINIYPLFLAIFKWDEQQLLEKEAPTHYKTPSNKLIPITYEDQKSPTVSVQLQELFGEINSPKIAAGKVSIRFELLSPARRPIQTTSDLENFWNNSYFEVAKEMRGRYPKHRWPEFPLLEKPGKSIRVRNVNR